MRLAIVLCLVSSIAWAEGRVFVPGGEISDVAARRAGVEGAWWALCGKGPSALVKVRARVVIHRDEVMGSTGFRSVATPGCDDPLLLMRGFSFLRARPLVPGTARVEDVVERTRYRVKLDGRVIFSMALDGDRWRDVNGSTVVWAGDLDGDGRRDLVLDVSYHDAATYRVLFLSTAARPGEAVREVARFEISSC